MVTARVGDPEPEPQIGLGSAGGRVVFHYGTSYRFPIDELIAANPTVNRQRTATRLRKLAAMREDTMPAQTAKQEALDAIQRLPDTADMEEIMYRLYVLENIRRGQQDAAEGKTIPAEQVLRDIQSW